MLISFLFAPSSAPFQAVISGLEADKLSRLAAEHSASSRRMLEAGDQLGAEAGALEADILALVLYLDTHGRERASAVSLSRALAEAAEILAQIKRRDFTEADIRARTELSEARILRDKVEQLVFGEVELSTVQEEVEGVEGLVTDLLQYINTGMTAVNEADDRNKRNKADLQRIVGKCQETNRYRESRNEGTIQLLTRKMYFVGVGCKQYKD